jgi:hypothetical protein
MSESIFQTFFLLASFNIALIAVAIANFAVSASYLGRETRLSRNRMEKRKEELKRKLSDMQKEDIEIKSMKREIEQAEKDIARLSTRIFLLSWVGAVIGPSVFFGFSLVIAVLGMNSESLIDSQRAGFLEQQFMILSSGALICGFIILLGVIRTIDFAAKEIPVPIFKIYFENRQTTTKLQRNVETQLLVCVKNIGEDVAKDVNIYLHFPPAFIPKEDIYYSLVKQADIGTDYPNHNSVILAREVWHMETVLSYTIPIKTPEEKKTYEIPVYIYESKTGLTKDKLTIEVTD